MSKGDRRADRPEREAASPESKSTGLLLAVSSETWQCASALGSASEGHQRERNGAARAEPRRSA
jgi:hypothetical protein